MTELEILTQIAADVRIILVFVVLEFSRRCLSAWRNNLKGGSK